MLITASQLKLISPISNILATEIAYMLNAKCPNYGINNKNLLEEFLATLIHESGNFTRKVENLNYATEKRLIEVFGKYFNVAGTGGKKQAAAYLSQPQKIANLVYENRMGNGDVNSGDGWNYRGGGFIQLTGKDMYTKYSDFKKEPIGVVRDKVRTLNEYALDSALWFYCIGKKLLGKSKMNDFLGITKSVNGGVNGWKERKAILERCKIVLKDAI